MYIVASFTRSNTVLTSSTMSCQMDIRKDYSAVLALCLEDKTYGEIRKNFEIPKSTLSTWFSNLKISNKAKKVLESKRKNP